MIPKENTLSVKDFSNVIKKGKVFRSRFFYVRILDNSEGKTRIGVGVGKKLAKKPSHKNYYKRVLRHLVKDVLSELENSYDIVVIGQEQMKGIKFDILKRDIEALFKKAGLLKI